MIDPTNIIIRGPNWVGDAVLSVPAMKAVRARFPRSEITLWVRPWVAGLFRSVSFVDHVWIHPGRSPSAWLRSVRELRQRPFDLGLLLPNSFESALTMFLGHIRLRAGYQTDSRGFLLTHGVSTPSGPLHQSDYYLDLVNRLFASDLEPSIDLTASEAQVRSARSLLSASGIDQGTAYAVVNPGAAFGSAKRWHPDRFARLADRIHDEMHLEIVIIGSGSERPIGTRVAAFMKTNAAVLSGRTDLETLLGLLDGASVVISNDSGPMHMAAALGTPTLALFGSTDPDVTRPLGPWTRILRHEVACSPCLLKECPIDHRCMDGLGVAEAFEATRSLAFGEGVSPPHAVSKDRE